MVAGRTHIPVIDHRRCNQCGACIHACPYWVTGRDLSDEFSLRNITGGIMSSVIPPEGSKYFEIPPCQSACPLGQNIPGYIGAISAGDFNLALEIILETNPLPSVLGRICTRPCTKACIRSQLDMSPDIRGLKYFASTQAKGIKIKRKEINREVKVSIIGSGPAGLAAAGILAGSGVNVVVYEKENEPGGALRFAVGEFDLPADDLKRDIERLKQAGVSFILNTEVNPPFDFNSFDKDADYIIVATGQCKRNDSEKSHLEKFSWRINAESFMNKIRRGEIKRLSGSVVVEGFGYSSATSARAALRAGALNVVIISEYSPSGDGFDSAKKEGIEIISPARIIDFNVRSGLLKSVRCALLKPGKIDSRGRIFDQVQCDEFEIKAETYISTGENRVGTGNLEKLSGINLHRIDPKTLETDRKNIFVAGSLVAGPISVISAASMGVKAAKAILGNIQKFS